MLRDAHKPLRLKSRASASSPAVVDLGHRREPRRGSAARLANARDIKSVYSGSKDDALSRQEREAIRRELAERFMPAARALPVSVSGLAALASERIEDAIARGQFKVRG